MNRHVLERCSHRAGGGASPAPTLKAVHVSGAEPRQGPAKRRAAPASACSLVLTRGALLAQALSPGAICSHVGPPPKVRPSAAMVVSSRWAGHHGTPLHSLPRPPTQTRRRAGASSVSESARWQALCRPRAHGQGRRSSDKQPDNHPACFHTQLALPAREKNGTSFVEVHNRRHAGGNARMLGHGRVSR